MESELLPCPMCDCRVFTTKFTVDPGNGHVAAWKYHCPKCRMSFLFNATTENDAFEKWNTRAARSSPWVPCSERLPEAKEGWEHSEQVLVWYQPTADAVGNYGIAYYHYNSPYQGSTWIDFAHLGREPIAWHPLVPYQILSAFREPELCATSADQSQQEER